MLTLSQVYKSPSAFLCALLAAGVSLADVRPGSSCDPLCKSVPGSAGWPSTETWASLNESTGGRLLRPSPPGAVCHPGQPTFDNATCRGVQAGWTSYEFHDADPVSVDWNQYSNDSCLPDPHYPCSGEGYPVFVINATTAEHVKLGVDFAREHHIRLIVKSSGHDFIGRSIAPNSLSIWTHHMTGLQTHESFQPKSCKVTIDGGAVTAGAGSAMAELYGALGAINRTVIGGGGKTVSLGGYLTGAGHSLLSSRYGLATDQVLEMEVVTPKGKILTINECSHQDLFWAMRGGGGSTFAIMTSVTVKTFPSPRLACGDIIVATDANSSAAKSVPDLAAYVVSQFPDLGDAGMSGYSYILRDFPNPYGPSSGSVAGFYASMCIQDTQDTTEFLKLWNPIFKHINETWPGFSIGPNLANFTSFSGWYAVNYDKSTTGTDSYVGSRLLDKKALTSNVTALAAALDRLSSGGTATAFLVSGKGVMDAKPRGGGDAVNPAWRKAYVHSTFGVEFEPLNASAKAEALQKINYMLEPMRELAPDMGAYMNEANPEEPDWQHQFWGDHYERLVEIKRDVDPQDVLWCTPCVGNERWKEHDGMLCRV